MRDFFRMIWRRLSAPPTPRRCVECYDVIADGVQCARCHEEMLRTINRPHQHLLNLGAETTPGTPVNPSDAVVRNLRGEVERAYLESAPAAAPVPDDEPFQSDTYPTLPTLPMLWLPQRRDTFTATLERWRGSLESLPPVREDWSGCCPWCAREMRETNGDTYTHKPRRVVITTCPRHRSGLLNLAELLRSERFGDDHQGHAGGVA